MHPSILADSWKKAAKKSVELLEEMAVPVDMRDRDSMIKSAITSLNSKVVSQYSNILAPLAVDSVMRVIDPDTAVNVDLRDIRVLTKIGGTVEDTKIVTLHSLDF